MTEQAPPDPIANLRAFQRSVHETTQRAASGPEADPGSTDRGTPVSGPQGAAQASELTPAEQAAAEELVRLSGPGGNPRWTAADFAYDARAIVAAVEPHHTLAALDQAEDDLGHLAGFNETAQSADWVDGVETARRIIRERADRIRSNLERTTTDHA